jgi:hypothetical protein
MAVFTVSLRKHTKFHIISSDQLRPISIDPLCMGAVAILSVNEMSQILLSASDRHAIAYMCAGLLPHAY